MKRNVCGLYGVFSERIVHQYKTRSSRSFIFLFTVNFDYGMICYLNRDLDGVRLNKVEDWRKKGVKRQFKRGAHPPPFPLH